jgi:hypothetical protein
MARTKAPNELAV